MKKNIKMKSTQDNFNFFAPAYLVKGKDAAGNKRMRLEGIASTASQDSDGEFLDPGGFELDYFLKYGYMNWNHQTNKDPLALIGRPTDAVNKAEGLFVGCDLFDNNPRAKEVYDLAEILEAQGLQMGFSIEGKVIERDKKNPKIVKKAKITGCAITPNPINRDTVAQIIKGNDFGLLSAYEDEDEDTREKALAAGSASSAALSKESLDSSTKVTTYGDHNWDGKITLSKGDVLSKIFTDNPSISRESAKELYNLIETIEKSISMDKNSDVTISPEAIEKAYKTLGLNKEGASTAEAAETTADDEGKDTTLEKGYDFKKMKKGELKKMKKELDDQLEKMEDDDDDDDEDNTEKGEGKDKETKRGRQPNEEGDTEEDHVKKGITPEAITAATDILKAAGLRVSIEEESDDPDLSKGEGGDDLHKEGQSNLEDLIKGEFASLREDTDAKIEAQTTLIKGFEDQIGELREELETYGSRSPGAKSVTSARAVDKSWENDLEKGIPGAEGGKPSLSTSRDRGRILDMLEDTYFKDEELVDKKLAKDTQVFESSGQISKAITDTIGKKGYELIQ